MPTPVELRGVIDEATRRGFPVQHVEHHYANRVRAVSKTRLIINGWRCRVYSISNVRFEGRHVYSMFGLAKSVLPTVDFVVVYVRVHSGETRLYIVPKKIIAREYKRGEITKRFFIPQQGITLWRSMHPRGILWPLYQDAWRLLE